MHCHDAQQNLNAAVDRELNWRERMALRAHLLRCAVCRAEMHAIRSLSQRLTTLPAPAEFAAAQEAVLTAAREAVSSSAPPARRLRPLVLAAAAGVLVIALTLFLVMRPSPAMAAYQSMISEIREVKTFHSVYWLGSPGMPRHEYEQWYQEGKWRLEEPNGMVQVYDGRQLDQYRPWNHTVFLGVSNQPFGTEFGGFTVADMLKREGNSQVEMSTTRGPDGNALSRFVVTGERERMVILADPRSDLPVSMEMYVQTPSGWELRGASETIEYNVPLSPDLFVLKPPQGATVIDHTEWDAGWERRYKQGLGRAMLGDHEVILRDMQVTTTGNVWTIWSGTKRNPTKYVTPGAPEWAGWYDVDAKLKDNLGTTYLRDFFGARGLTGAFFVPVVAPASQPAWYELTVIERSGPRGERVQSARLRVTQPAYSPLPEPIYPAPKGDPRQGFVFARGLMGEADQAQMRAEYWEKQGDLHKALSFWEQSITISDAYADHRNWSQPYWWRHIGELYEKLGMREEAKRAYQRGLDCDDGQEGNRADVKALREALERLR